MKKIESRFWKWKATWKEEIWRIMAQEQLDAMFVPPHLNQ
jgi:hypothetical protein